MPERIGAYRLESPLGRGGMGEVFLAWDERLERAVAIKRIRHDAFVEGHQRERFRREARMAARLSHAAIVQVHDLVSEESGDAIVMEYVEGLTLAERLARGPLDPAEAVHLAREIAEGLAAAHEAGLIHRDLKAENVVITPSGHAKILDFGLARPVCWDGEMLTQHGALVGTCYAMSPEQASGGDLDERSDLFALGALLYEMLTNCSAFRAKDPRATLQRVLYEQPPALGEVRPDLPPALVSLVERLLAKDRDDRPRSALSVVHKLERIEHELPVEWPEQQDDSLSDMPTEAFPALPGRRSGSAAISRPAPSGPAVVEGPLRRARGWILFLSGALVALVSAVAITLFLARQPSPSVSPVDQDLPVLLGFQTKIEEGFNLDDAELERLEEIIKKPPQKQNLRALILASEAYRSRFKSTRDRADRDLAIEYAVLAQERSPFHPRPVVSHFKIALEWEPTVAEQDLKRLETLIPRDPQLLIYRGLLADRRGQTDEALTFLRAGVKQDPSWRNLRELVDLEMRLGHVPDARQHLDDLRRVAPNNVWVIDAFAVFELRYGDIAKAEEHYLRLTTLWRKRSYFTNLGLARSLLGNYEGAIDAYGKALGMAPDQPEVLLNLAEAELAQKEQAEAEDHLNKALESIEARKATSLTPKDRMIQAQCLARLSRIAEAVDITQRALKKGSADSEVLYMAAVVYSLANERQSALSNAKGALKKGYRPEWFNLDAFGPLREDPELQDMLQKAASSRSS